MKCLKKHAKDVFCTNDICIFSWNGRRSVEVYEEKTEYEPGCLMRGSRIISVMKSLEYTIYKNAQHMPKRHVRTNAINAYPRRRLWSCRHSRINIRFTALKVHQLSYHLWQIIRHLLSAWLKIYKNLISLSEHPVWKKSDTYFCHLAFY